MPLLPLPLRLAVISPRKFEFCALLASAFPNTKHGSSFTIGVSSSLGGSRRRARFASIRRSEAPIAIDSATKRKYVRGVSRRTRRIFVPSRARARGTSRYVSVYLVFLVSFSFLLSFLEKLLRAARVALRGDGSGSASTRLDRSINSL